MSNSILKKERKTLKELLEKGQVFTPCVYDCLSARSVLLNGFDAMLLSGGALAWCMCGIPDIGLLSPDELVWATSRISAACPLPMIVDTDDGYGSGPLNTYRIVRRLAEAGAMAVSIDDSTGIRGWERQYRANRKPHQVVPREEFYAKIKAAVKACEGTDCLVIARSEAMPTYGIDEAIDRVVRCRELGAHITLVMGIKTLEQGKRIAERDIGWKMWPDIGVTDGKSDVELDDIAELGFNLVTMHYTEQAALRGMLDVGRENFKNRNSVYSSTVLRDCPELADDPTLAFVDYPAWLDLEDEFLDV